MPAAANDAAPPTQLEAEPEPTMTLNVGPAAGVASGAHGSQYTYFERPLTPRDSTRVPPTIESSPKVSSDMRTNQRMASVIYPDTTCRLELLACDLTCAHARARAAAH